MHKPYKPGDLLEYRRKGTGPNGAIEIAVRKKSGVWEPVMPVGERYFKPGYGAKALVVEYRDGPGAMPNLYAEHVIAYVFNARKYVMVSYWRGERAKWRRVNDSVTADELTDEEKGGYVRAKLTGAANA